MTRKSLEKRVSDIESNVDKLEQNDDRSVPDLFMSWGREAGLPDAEILKSLRAIVSVSLSDGITIPLSMYCEPAPFKCCHDRWIDLLDWTPQICTEDDVNMNCIDRIGAVPAGICLNSANNAVDHLLMGALWGQKPIHNRLKIAIG